MKNIIESLEDFLNDQIDTGLKIAQITKWGRQNTLKIDILLKLKGGFASLQDCENVHKLVLIWSKKENIEKNLNISVQSESINKILFDFEDFEENIGKKIKIETKTKIEDRRNFTGFLKQIKDGIIYLKSEHENLSISFDQVKKAQLLLI
ncbi:hypothetical protein [Alphaproteobacteria bacterium endosymbiont of Tiliacea citrago]|uniref:ribosome maturation factor RimP n=1 Tax=Alphaproteobacteria bacterium endosymbiont of Tiliacea citrago TaxID=3077944 RepID=UPI00313C8B18